MLTTINGPSISDLREYIDQSDLKPRHIFRSPTNNGSVILFEMFGEEKAILVLDAKYRSIKKWGKKNEKALPMQFEGDVLEYVYTFSNPKAKLAYPLCDLLIELRFPGLRGDQTAAANTDALVRSPEAEAALWCREHGFDLPNNFELLIIYLEADRLDALDPTVDSYPDFALGIKNPNGRFNFKNTGAVWSSTEFNDACARFVSTGGQVYGLSKDVALGVTPIIEIDMSEILNENGKENSAKDTTRDFKDPNYGTEISNQKTSKRESLIDTAVNMANKYFPNFIGKFKN